MHSVRPGRQSRRRAGIEPRAADALDANVADGPDRVPTRPRRVEFNPGLLRTFSRLLVWSGGVLQFAIGTAWAALMQRNTIASRAVRLRQIIERMGPTFIKLGQQLSLRADLLDFAYCQELSKMQESVPPMPTETARRVIERSTGRRIEEMFAWFETDPVGSGSLATVYRAMRTDGRVVAVKVRRPGISQLLAADLRAVFWLLRIGQIFTLIRDDMVDNLEMDLTSMLLEELDFCIEARHLEIFQKRALSANIKIVTAPDVHFDLSGEEVLVMQFVEGVPMTEILSAVDRADIEALARLERIGIDPVLAARRLMHVFNWETLESLIFHADPHPANIRVQPDNTLTFIDFGSCGHLSSKNRRIWQQLQHYLTNEDVSGITTAVLQMMEPLPPIDVHKYRSELQDHFRQWMFALKSDHSSWWERSSGVLWIRLVGVARRYGVPFQLDTLRLVRTLFAIDTIMFRLYPGLDPTKEFKDYQRSAARRVRRRYRRLMGRRLRGGPTPDDVVRLNGLLDTANAGAYALQRGFDNPTTRFREVVDKVAYAFLGSTQIVIAAVMGFALLRLGAWVWRLFTGETVALGTLVDRILASDAVQVILAVATILFLRRLAERLRAMDVYRTR